MPLEPWGNDPDRVALARRRFLAGGAFARDVCPFAALKPGAAIVVISDIDGGVGRFGRIDLALGDRLAVMETMKRRRCHSATVT